MKYKLVFLDTETTGNEADDSLCQIAFKTGNDARVCLFKPHKLISIDAMAVHHITNKMVEDKPAFKFSNEHKILKDWFSDENTVLVAHNARFDVGMLKKEELYPQNIICTLRVARHLDSQGKIPRHSLQYLRYYLGIELEATAHDAMGDVLVLEALFDRLLKKMTETLGSEENAIKEMIEISSRPSLMQAFSFGKHIGKTVEEVAKTDRNYLEWLLAQKIQNEADEEDWIYTLKHYLGK